MRKIPYNYVLFNIIAYYTVSNNLLIVQLKFLLHNI